MTEPRIVIVSPAERAVIGELTRDGATNRTIGARLGVTDHVVRNHLKATMKRTGHASRTALVVDLLSGRMRLRTLDRDQWPRERIRG